MNTQNVDLLFENNPNPMWVYHPESLNIVQANKVAQRLYGYSKNEFLEMTILDLHRLKNRSEVIQLVEGRATKFNQSGVWEHQTKEGRSLFVRVFSHPIQVSGDNYKLAVAVDITEQKQFEKRFHHERELVNIIIEQLPGTFFVFNKDGIMLRWNKQLEKITEFSHQEVEEKPILTYFGEDEQPKIKEAITTAFTTGRVEVESEVIKKSGGRVPILFNASRAIYHSEECIVGIGLDISQQVKIIREKEILLSEVHHRVKNNLALINSLLYLQASETKGGYFKQLLHDTQVRIKIIALVHELLYQGESFTQIKYGSFLEQLLKLLQQVYKSNDQLSVSLTADSLELNVNQALPLSLLINEIFSVVHKNIRKDSAPRQLDIVVVENGNNVELTLTYGGEFHFIESGSDGNLSDLLMSVLCDQLEAEFNHSTQAPSTCTIEFEKSMNRGSVAGIISELM